MSRGYRSVCSGLSTGIGVASRTVDTSTVPLTVRCMWVGKKSAGLLNGVYGYTAVGDNTFVGCIGRSSLVIPYRPATVTLISWSIGCGEVFTTAVHATVL